MLVSLNAVWLTLVLFGLPGNWLMLISTCLFAWWRVEEHVFSTYTLIAVTALAVLGEIMEFFGGMAGAKRKGAGWRGSLGAILGAITGAIVGTFLIPIPFLGTLLGSCIGAGIGAWALELFGGGQVSKSTNLAFGAGIGQLIGLSSKAGIGIIIWLVIAVAVFWP